MAKMPAFQFYPADWRKSPDVQAMSFFDRGVWFEILCLMHESDERGRLMLAGKPMNDESLMRILGISRTKLENSLNTILSLGVAYRDDDGALCNRRMMRDESMRQGRAESGHLGGNPKLKGLYNKPGNLYVIGFREDGAVKVGITINTTKRLYKLRHTTRNPNLMILAECAVEDMGIAEMEIHQSLAQFQDHGEWFKLPKDEYDKLIFLMEERKGKETPSSSSSSSSSSSERSKNGETPVAAVAAVDNQISWIDAGIELLGKAKMTEAQARPFLGRLAKQYSAAEMHTAIEATDAEKPADVKAFLIAVLQKRAKDKGKMQVGRNVPSTEADFTEKCLICFDTGSVIVKDGNGKMTGSEICECTKTP